MFNEQILTEGARRTDRDRAYVIAAEPAVEILLPTGRVVGCDPLVYAGDTEPFTVTVEPGRYALRPWTAVVDREGRTLRRTTALQLVIRDEPAVRWEPALLPGQDPAELAEGESFGYPVDAGSGTLADEVAIRGVARWDEDRLDETFIPAQLPSPPIVAVTDEATGAQTAVVSSGWGDGVYSTYVGRTADGRVACFVTDFSVF